MNKYKKQRTVITILIILTLSNMMIKTFTKFRDNNRNKNKVVTNIDEYKVKEVTSDLKVINLYEQKDIEKITEQMDEDFIKSLENWNYKDDIKLNSPIEVINGNSSNCQSITTYIGEYLLNKSNNSLENKGRLKELNIITTEDPHMYLEIKYLSDKNEEIIEQIDLTVDKEKGIKDIIKFLKINN